MLKKILLLLMISSVIIIYYFFIPEIRLLKKIYIEMLRPFYDYKIGNLICRDDICLYVSKDCVGIYTFLMALCFYILTIENPRFEHIVLLILLSFLVDYVRLTLILLSNSPKEVHTFLTLILPLVSYGITIFIKKIAV